MEREPKRQPTLSDSGRREAAERQKRQAAALRENLAKRKAQQRARVGGQAAGPTAGGRGEPGRDR